MSALMARRYYQRGLQHVLEGQLDDACQSFQGALHLVPGYTEARLSYASALIRLRDGARAVGVLRAGLAHATQASERVQLLRGLGDALMAAGDLGAAEQALLDAVQGEDLDRSGAAEVHDQLARLRARTGRFAEAFDHLLAAARATT